MNEIQKTRIARITELHAEIGGYLKMTLDKAIEIGGLLAEQKADLDHGEWLPWISENLSFSERLARDYMRFYDHREELKTANLADLTAARRFLTDPPWDDPGYYWNGPAVLRRYEQTGDPHAVGEAITRMWGMLYDDFVEQDVQDVEKWKLLSEGTRKWAQACAEITFLLEAKLAEQISAK